MIYVVLGMHKSGTTLISQILHYSGISMVDGPATGISYDEGNKYERQDVLSLNLDLLGAVDHEILALARPVPLSLSGQQRQAMRKIIAACETSYANWGFKEPRTTLTYPLWQAELPPHRIIAVYRCPDEIWPRFRWRGLRRRYVNPYRAWQFASRWIEHNQALVEYLRNTAMDYILIDYRRLMSTDDEFQRLERFIGQQLRDMRRKSLYREKMPKSDLLLAIASAIVGVTAGKTMRQIWTDLDKLRSASL